MADYPLFGEIVIGQTLPPLEHLVTATTVVLGAMASRDWRPMHHDRNFAIERNGVRDIFLNTPTQAAWLERYITDWSGPKGRLTAMSLNMESPICPGDIMCIRGRVTKLNGGPPGCGLVTLALNIHVGERRASYCETGVLLPLSETDNPWTQPLSPGETWSK